MKDTPMRNREDLLDEGERHFDDGDYERALGVFDEAIANDEDDAEAHYLRGRALFYLQKDEEAERAYDRALDLDPQFAPALIHKAELLVRGHQLPEEALMLVADAEELELNKVDRIELNFVRGVALMEQGEHRRALESLNRAVRGDGEWAEALRERGVCRFYLWRFEEAERDLARAVEKDPGDGEALYFLAMCQERRGNLPEADRNFAGAARIDGKAFPVPARMSREDFDRVADAAIAALPEEFRLRFDNLSFEVQDFPAPGEDLHPDTMVGVFEGQALTDRHPYDLASAPTASQLVASLLPARIVLFQRNLERLSLDLSVLKDEIARTVLHEVGHYFGMTEEDMVRLDIH